jgi:hypothetical protein
MTERVAGMHAPDNDAGVIVGEGKWPSSVATREENRR